jgi:regulator of protease activity HflC (stomatin/prohibitin superfamily)
MFQEIRRSAASGWLMLPLFLVLMALLAYGAVESFRSAQLSFGILAVLLFAMVLFCLNGFLIINPNEARVLQLFGDYVGTLREPGLRWANPFLTSIQISLRARNFESGHLKVNDAHGNPIEIAAIVVWRVVDTAEACFVVDSYEDYVKVQTESAVRNLATRYPYDAHEEHELSLRGSSAEVAKALKSEIQERLNRAGVEVVEARISHLAYAQEIAAAMLRRQQAGAIIAARQKIVEGAVGMVEMALDMLARSTRVTLDEERKAAMVSNLLVVLCADREAQPVINTGTIYQ